MSIPSPTTLRKTIAALGLAALFGGITSTGSAQQQQPSGAEVWSKNCGRCHRMRAVDAYNASQWNTVVTHMALTARLTPEETDAIREFLVGSARAREAGSSAIAPSARALHVTSRTGEGEPERVLLSATGCPAVPGAQTYKAQCEMCHGAKGKGDGPVAAALKPRPSDLSDTARMAKLTDDSLTAVITSGRKTMPGFAKILTPEQIRGVVEFLRCLGTTPSPGTGTR
jgi:mono/diheme cytochrome c family protein